MVEKEKTEISIDGKKLIKTKDSEIPKGQVALITEQKLPLTVIDDFVVRPIGKKLFSEKNNGKSEKVISSNLPISDLESGLFNSQSQKGKGPYAESFEFNELLNSSTPEPDPIYQTTTTLPPTELILYYHHDHLGNIRAITDQNKNVVERHDFYPFGEEITTPQSKDSHLFTGKQRDSETGLDYFGARYYASGLGRWLSPDTITDIKRNIENPQRWNLYVYVLNNPLKFLDLEGNEEKVSYFIVVDPSPKVLAEKLSWVLSKISYELGSFTDTDLRFYLKDQATLQAFKEELKESSMVAFLGHSYSQNAVATGLIFSDNTLKAGTPIGSKAPIVFLAACRTAADNSRLPELFSITKDTKGRALVGFAGKPQTGYMAEAIREFSKWILQGYSVGEVVKKTNEYLQNKINEMNKKRGRQQYQFIPLTIIGDPNVSLSE